MKKNIVVLFTILTIVLSIACAVPKKTTLLGDASPQQPKANPVPVTGNTVIPGGLGEAPPPLPGNQGPVMTPVPTGVEETPETSSPSFFTLGNQNSPRVVRIKVGDKNLMKSLYTTMITSTDENRRLIKFSTPTQSATIKDVKPGVYYLNIEGISRRWAVENDPPVQGQHRKLTFNVYISVNDGPWVQLGSADTEQVGGQWWNLKLVIP